MTTYADRCAVYDKALGKWGLRNQFLVAIEEMSEVQKAITKLTRTFDKQHTCKEALECFNNLIEEIADAETDCGDFYPDWFEVDPTTIGECTGETDKKGRLIFEGHIVKGKYNYKYVVEYGRHDLSCCGCCHDSHEAVGFYLKDKYGYPHSDDEAWHDLEIIGNIHDNPELLKGGEG